ncbi:hypothetical protein [Marinitenerispora sediminis]|uniref:Uncharacterized protein n=1 Tax=Marinitenerispora sediminis TaxID=1931232 RepID=A0A368TBP6_9ACTN|nr:hypothetical protein [Marinitenerispora sediminis]RCV57779.1 hypothetical protein DEF28_01035 [Marinitenerispora sediminis]RCV57911.1 hypothetical protein DEF23_09900 [Marinitenerispora sediminis]RCV60664.1 hypothetical protein DEF24_06630 [Marinitenerispora sediminis]
MSYTLHVLLNGLISGLFSTLVSFFLGGFALLWAGRAPAGRGLVRFAGALLLVDALITLGRAVLGAMASYPGPSWQEPSLDLLAALGPVPGIVSTLVLVGAGILLLAAAVRGSRRTPAAGPTPPAAYPGARPPAAPHQPPGVRQQPPGAPQHRPPGPAAPPGGPAPGSAG